MVCFNSVDHASTLLQSLFVSEKYSDLTISAGKTGKCWNVHKAILAESTKYFEMMLSSSFKEASDYKIVINDVDSDVLETVLKFLYFGSVDITDVDFAERLLEQAHLMQIPELFKYCFEYLANNLTAENCIGFYFLTVKYEEKEMTKKFLQFAIDHFLEVVEYSHYFDLDFEQLIMYLSNISPSALVEEGKVLAILKWIDYNPTIRLIHIGECIRKLIDFEFITDMIIFHKLLNICENHIDFQYLNRKLIKIHCDPQIIMVCEKDQTNNSVLNFNIKEKKTYDLGEIPKNHTILAVWDDMLVIATEDLEDVRTIYACDLINFNNKKYTNPLLLTESPKDAVILDDDLYIMIQACVYKFELKKGALHELRTVEGSYLFRSLTIFQRKLYLMLLDNNRVKMVCFNPDANEWNTICDNDYNLGPYEGSLTVDSNYIYYFNHNVHCFDLKQRVWTKTQSWNFAAVSAVRAGSEILFANNKSIYKYAGVSNFWIHPFFNVAHTILKLLEI